MNSENKIVINDSFYEYVKQNLNEDVMRLRLKKRNSENFSIDLAITQIEIRRKHIEHKIPTWAQNDSVVFPSLLSAEQCSSEATARYKSHLVIGNSLCDMTGGLGVDTYFMSQGVTRTTYIERDEKYCQLAKHNFTLLGSPHIQVINDDCCNFISNCNETFDTIFIDPARRGKQHERLFALADCEPDVLSLLPTILGKCQRLIIKMSPMVDITQLKVELARPFDLHILSVRNECKELLAVINTQDLRNEKQPVNIICAMPDNTGTCREVRFTMDDESNAPQAIAQEMGNFLYEPDVALLKAGAFKTVCLKYNVKKLHKNSHLYTSSEVVTDFPGRTFAIKEIIPFSSSMCKSFAKHYDTCNITTRNFPLSAVELRKKLKVRDGGEIYLFATTNSHDKSILVICNKI